MVSWLLRRIFHAALTFLGITLAVFLLIHAVPGDPIRLRIAEARPGASLDPEALRLLRKEHHLDRPLVIQYGYWLGEVVSLDFGVSHVDRRPVTSRIAEKLPNTLLLNAAALLLSLILAVPLGVIAAMRSGTPLDRGSGLFFSALYSLPSFWAALLLIELLSVKLGLLPLYGMASEGYGALSLGGRFADRAAHLVLPLIALSYPQLAIFGRFTRSAVLEVIGSDFITTARAKGAGEYRVVFSHALRNALIPLTTLVGMTIPYLVSGSVIVEKIFEWDGVGRLYVESVMARDYPTVMGLTVLTAVVTLLAYLATDLAYTLADPRIRLEGRR